MGRPYKLRRRAEAQAETRQKIVDAAVALHEEKGVADTSVSDIAVRAGVGKVTVYRHFPDEAALVTACSGHYFQQHPFPDPEPWWRVADPHERLRLGLGEIYAYHRETQAMLHRFLPEGRDHPVMAGYEAHWRRAAEVLADAWPEAMRRDAERRAALALVLSFEVWQLLSRWQGLSDTRAIDVAIRFLPEG